MIEDPDQIRLPKEAHQLILQVQTIERLKRANKQLSVSLTEAKSALAAADERIVQLSRPTDAPDSTQVGRLRAQLDAERATSGRLRAELQEAKSQMSVDRTRTVAAKNIEATWENDRLRLEGRLDRLMRATSELKEENRTLTETLRAAQRDRENSDKQHAQLQLQLQAALTQAEGLRQSLTTSQRRVDSLKTEQAQTVLQYEREKDALTSELVAVQSHQLRQQHQQQQPGSPPYLPPLGAAGPAQRAHAREVSGTVTALLGSTGRTRRAGSVTPEGAPPACPDRLAGTSSTSPYPAALPNADRLSVNDLRELLARARRENVGLRQEIQRLQGALRRAEAAAPGKREPAPNSLRVLSYLEDVRKNLVAIAGQVARRAKLCDDAGIGLEEDDALLESRPDGLDAGAVFPAGLSAATDPDQTPPPPIDEADGGPLREQPSPSPVSAAGDPETDDGVPSVEQEMPVSPAGVPVKEEYAPEFEAPPLQMAPHRASSPPHDNDPPPIDSGSPPLIQT
ncbi:hypothetical protein PAPYR_9947 [Paratrimastix pyriformis]|uniref:Uncharacterized protein n=1 Tax=Paratrimastix pyriformis TaxID=342808 RepID=A0ABQ8U9W3_9EUKA|nr:hypothetical protein PAPYR_9947 [Paratrimastix pyriformis]